MRLTLLSICYVLLNYEGTNIRLCAPSFTEGLARYSQYLTSRKNDNGWNQCQIVL